MELRIKINKYSTLLLLSSIILGTLFPNISNILRPFLIYFVIVILFLGFSATDFDALKKEIINWKYQLYLIILTLIIIPLISYGLAYFLAYATNTSKYYAIATLIIFSSPIAAAAPTFCLLMYGHLERALVAVVTTSILAPLTIPLLFYFLLGHNITIDHASIAIFMSKIIFIPLIAAVILRLIAPKFNDKCRTYVTPTSIILICLVVFASASNLKHLLITTPLLAIETLLFTIIIFAVAFTLGWFLALKKEAPDKTTTAIVSTWNNMGIAIIITHQFFAAKHPITMLFILIAMAVWNIAIIPAKWLANFTRQA